jgi:hypothetical protein
VGPLRRDPSAAHGRFTGHDRTVLQFWHGEGRDLAELSRSLPHRLHRCRRPRNR